MTAGGKRPGAGRPKGTTKSTARGEMLAVRLTAEQRAIAERIGMGNASEGIRRALDAAKESRQCDASMTD